jgi:endonuclease-3
MSEPAAPVVWPPDPERVEMIFERLAGVMPEPKTELRFQDPYTLVVAVALSAQATDVSVNKATEKLFAVAHTPAQMLALGEAGLIPFIQSIGLYRTKARNVIRAAEILQSQYGGQVPLERAALQSLPGVGRKTASVVLNELGVEAAIAVDTHVFRVADRLGLANASTPDKVEAQLMRVVPDVYLPKAHHWLILHGRYTCKAQRPLCESCVIADLCPSRRYYAAGTPGPKTQRSAARRTARAKPAPASGSKPR